MLLNSAREVALNILLRVEEEKAYSNLLLSSVFKKESLSNADRGLVTEIVYGTITWRDRLDYTIGQYSKGSIHKLDKWVLVLLRLSFYQLLFLERVPSYAVVNEAVNIAKRRGHRGISSFVNGILRSYLREPKKAEIQHDLEPIPRIALEQSHPQWLVKRWVDQFGEKVTEEICIANNEPSTLSIRVNSLKIHKHALIQKLADENVSTVPAKFFPQALRIESSGNPIDNTSFKDGLYTIQDESSMLVGHLLNAQTGMKVLDACAAPGGKSTHIAEIMQNEGSIIANDLHVHKEKLIQEQAKRLGISIIETTVADAYELPERNLGSFDRILLDAPCTGFGVIRRKPDLKWHKQLRDIKSISYIQYQLLVRIAPLLKRGGKLIYSTCTIEAEENQQLIQRFLLEHPQYKLDDTMVDDLPDELKEKVEVAGMLQILPQYWGTDGFFIARLTYA